MDFLDKYDDDLIDDYLMDLLEEKDKALFEQNIAVDKELALYINTKKELISGIIAYAKNNLSINIKNVTKTLDEEGFFITDDDIDAYLNNSSTMSENRKIALLCIKDENFKQRVTNRQTLLNSIHAIAQQQLKASIAEVETSLETTGFFEQTIHKTESSPTVTIAKNKVHFKIIQWTAVAASILILVLAARFWIFPTKSTSLNYHNHFTVLEDKLSPKINAELSESGFGGNPTVALRELQKGMKFYQTKNYAASVSILKSYIKKNPMAHNIQEVQLYTAISYMELNLPKEALPFLLSLSASEPKGEIAIDLQWYLALCYLENDQKNSAIPLLNALKDNNRYQNKAHKLLQELN